jgi:L-2-hydroxycarboxylate dehydrogenase (NAD+)
MAAESPAAVGSAVGHVRVFAVDARRWIVDVFAALGAPAAAAGHQADQLVEADLRDRPSHGIQRLPVLAERIHKGLIEPAAQPDLEWLGEAFLRVDGHFGLGPAVTTEALDALLERARETGVAMGAIANSGHLGMLAPYLEQAVAAGAVVIAMTTSEALVHPHGGSLALIGTNPIGIGVPTGDGEPFILDMATGAISMGAVIAAAHRGDRLPEGVAVDATGLPTTDPHAALTGAISPFGGAKGYGLGLGVELLVGLLTATALGADVRGTLDTEHAVTKGDLFVVIDPKVLRLEELPGRAARFLAEITGSPSAAGATAPVSVPGRRSRRTRALRLTEGYDVPRAVFEQVRALHDGLVRGAISA